MVSKNPVVYYNHYRGDNSPIAIPAENTFVRNLLMRRAVIGFPY